MIMKINVKAKPNSREEKVKKINDGNYIVSVKEMPIDGMANRAIIKAIGNYLGISPLRIRIVFGRTSGRKVLEID
jgi:uncharacterized protein